MLIVGHVGSLECAKTHLNLAYQLVVWPAFHIHYITCHIFHLKPSIFPTPKTSSDINQYGYVNWEKIIAFFYKVIFTPYCLNIGKRKAFYSYTNYIKKLIEYTHVVSIYNLLFTIYSYTLY